MRLTLPQLDALFTLFAALEESDDPEVGRKFRHRPVKLLGVSDPRFGVHSSLEKIGFVQLSAGTMNVYITHDGIQRLTDPTSIIIRDVHRL